MSDDERLSGEEAALVGVLAHAWNKFCELPVEHNDDLDEFRRAIHAAQEKVLARPARRMCNRIGL